MKALVSVLVLILALLALAMLYQQSNGSDQALTQGQTIWLKNCAVCHQQGLGGAPMIGNTKQWLPRMEQGLPTLVQHALQGYSGATGEMPARGGKPALTDEEVRLAVTYMVSKVEQVN